MSEMVERVAQRLSYCAGYMHQDGWEAFDDFHKNKFREWARAAILAMREPTEGMIEATGVRTDYSDFGVSDLINGWHDMIDAALAEPKP